MGQAGKSYAANGRGDGACWFLKLFLETINSCNWVESGCFHCSAVGLSLGRM